jgi:hypothetical protein
LDASGPNTGKNSPENRKPSNLVKLKARYYQVSNVVEIWIASNGWYLHSRLYQENSMLSRKCKIVKVILIINTTFAKNGKIKFDRMQLY